MLTKTRYLIVGLAVLMAILVQYTYAQTETIKLIGQLNSPGGAWDVAISGNYAYLADDGLRIINVSNPASPYIVGNYDVNVQTMAVNGGYAYLSIRGGGLKILNISNPANPTLVGSYDSNSYFSAVTINGNYAYLGTVGLKILDISNPTNPTLVGSYDGDSSFSTVTINGNYAYVGTDGKGLKILNISNPANPTLVGSYNDGASWVADVVVRGDYAYVGSAIVSTNLGLHIINISNPANPYRVGSYTFPDFRNIVVRGNYAYIGNGYSNAGTLRTPSLQIINISNPANPTFVASYNNLKGHVQSIAANANDNYIYIADGINVGGTSMDGYLTVLQHTSSTNPTPVPTTPAAFSCNNVTQIPRIECEALVALYNSTNGVSWTNKNGWLNTNTPCSWNGITCNGNSVTKIVLYDNKLNGYIPTNLGNFSNLEVLTLAKNQLSGNIPFELKNLIKLNELNLTLNQLNGSIPSQLGNLTNIVYFYLDYNQLSGGIPVEIGNLTKLKQLYLNKNQLTGSLPSQIGNLTNLTVLSVGDNQLSGSLPLNLINLKLNRFRFNNTSLCEPNDATFQNWLATISELSRTDVRCANSAFSCNNVTEIPRLECEALVALYNNTNGAGWSTKYGWLSTNTPCAWTGVTCSGNSVTELKLYTNKLSGYIPTNLGNFTNLEVLQLANNQLVGNIPTELKNLLKLNELDLAKNQLTGSVPPEIGNLTNLMYFYLDYNQLSGGIPVEIGNLTKLKQRYLNKNQLSGNLPSRIGNLTNLTEFSVGDNQLSGSLPLVLTNLKLSRFRFNNTSLCEPNDATFQNWLATISELSRTDVKCASPATAVPTATPLPYVEVNPATLGRGQTFSQPGYHFHPYSKVYLHFRYPDGYEASYQHGDPNTLETAGSDGSYQHQWQVKCNSLFGQYSYWAEDDQGGKAAAKSFTVAGNASCPPSVIVYLDGTSPEPSSYVSAPQGAKFQQPGFNFSSNVTLSFKYPDQHVSTNLESINSNGDYSHVWQTTCDTPVGKYTYWATDSGGHSSAEITFEVTANSACKYSIFGKVTLINGLPLPGVLVKTNSAANGTTDVNGNYEIKGLLAGTYTVSPVSPKYKYTQLSQQVTVSASSPNMTNVDFLVKPPMVIMHGIQLFSSSGYKCEQKIGRYEDGTTVNTMVDMPGWFDEKYDVWIAHVTTGMDYTASLDSNAACLVEQINYAYEESGRLPVVVVAHSMGGLVARKALASPDVQSKVMALYTLGSPHAGLNITPILQLSLLFSMPPYGLFADVAFCNRQSAACEMGSLEMILFNQSTPNLGQIPHIYIAGDETPWKPLGGILLFTEGYNDGFIGTSSALGWAYPTGLPIPPWWSDKTNRYVTDETHAGDLGGYFYHQSRPEQFGGGKDGRSQAYHCIMWREGYGLRSDSCRDAVTNSSRQTKPTTKLSATTINVSGHLANNGAVTHIVPVDSDKHAIFYLAWLGGQPLNFTLTRPDGQLINPTVASTDANVEYDASQGGDLLPPMATYSFTATQPGLWTLNIQGNNVPAAGINYTAFVVMETERVLSLKPETDLYQADKPTTLKAELKNGSNGISGAVVTITLRRPDNKLDTVSLVDMGNGFYQADYTVPNTPGYLEVTVTAEGNDNGTPFVRQVNQLLMVGSSAVQLNNRNNDYIGGTTASKKLIFETDVVATQAGTYTVSANLFKGDVLITTISIVKNLIAGNQTIELEFLGRDIYNSKLDGAYSVSNLLVTDWQNGSVPAINVAQAHTTKAYQYIEFKPATIYLPMIVR